MSEMKRALDELQNKPVIARMLGGDVLKGVVSSVATETATLLPYKTDNHGHAKFLGGDTAEFDESRTQVTIDIAAITSLEEQIPKQGD